MGDKKNFIRFTDNQGDLVGRLFLKDGVLAFEGKATEAAQMFLEEVARKFNTMDYAQGVLGNLPDHP